MSDFGRILIADDEKVFLQSTGDLLRKYGYECDCVCDAIEAAEKLKESRYDLLIADIKMPGNEELDLIKNMVELAEGVPVILVTGYPSLQTAIDSVRLPVACYMVKPMDIDELLFEIQNAIRKHKVYESIHNIREHLQHWSDCFADIEHMLRDSHSDATSVPVESFIEIAFQNVIETLSDIQHLTKSLAHVNDDKESCHLFNCPKLESLGKGVTETIRVLENTKSSFKSKELGKMRRKLEEISGKD